jgi:hypothetical protein
MLYHKVVEYKNMLSEHDDFTHRYVERDSITLAQLRSDTDVYI